MSIYTALKKDHEEVKGIIKKLEKDLDNDEHIKQLQKELSLHNPSEEKIFYKPLSKKVPSLGVAITAGTEEHELVLKLVKQFSKMKNGAKEKKTLLSIIKKSLLAHIDVEENEIFSVAKEQFSSEEAKKIEDDFNTEKEKLKKKASK